jgi:hypothetical protein
VSYAKVALCKAPAEAAARATCTDRSRRPRTSRGRDRPPLIAEHALRPEDADRLYHALHAALRSAIALSCPAFSGLANLRLSYAAAVISRYSSMTSCGVRYPSAE